METPLVGPLTLNVITNQSVDEAASLTVVYSANGGDGNWLFTSTGIPAFGGLVDDTGGNATLTFDPTYLDSGSYPIEVTVTDGAGETVTETFSLTVIDVNAPPVFAAIADQTMNEGDTVDLTATITDADGDIATISSIGRPAFVTITDNGDNTANINFAPLDGDDNTYDFRLRATDGNGGVAEITINLTVNDTNEAPVVDAISDQSVDGGRSLSINMSATDADGDSMTYSISGLDANFMTLTDNGDGTADLAVTSSVSDVGTYPLTVTVQDSNGNSGQETFNLTVVNVCSSVSLPSGMTYHLVGFDGSSNISDLSGNGRNATFGSGRYTISNSSSINSGNRDATTFAARFTTGSNVTSRQMVYEQGGTINGISVYVYQGQVYGNIWSTSQGWSNKFFSANASANTEYYVVLVYGKPDLEVYVNGSLAGSVNDLGTLNSHTGNISVTANGDTLYHDGSTGSTDTFGGTVDEIVHWNSALSSSGVENLNIFLGCGGTDPSSVTPSNNAPTLASISDANMLTTETLTVNLSASDGDSDTVNLQYIEFAQFRHTDGQWQQHSFNCFQPKFE